MTNLDKQERTLFQFEYQPPYRWEEMLSFLELRAIPGVETVVDGEYCRTVRHNCAESEEVCGWIKIGHSPKKNTLLVTISEPLLQVVPQILARVTHLFDLHCDPNTVYETLISMNEVHPHLCVLGTRVPGCYNAFEMATRAILGQQITVKAASTLAGRMAAKFGAPIETGIEGLSRTFPTPHDLLASGIPFEDQLGPLGIISSRSKTIESIAQALISEEIILDASSDPEKEMEKLLSIKGIGNWTAHYLAMRTMGWSDAFLETDIGIKKALGPATPKEMLAMAEAWRPWRSYATVNLWNSLTRIERT